MKLRECLVFASVLQCGGVLAQSAPAPAWQWQSGQLSLQAGLEAQAAYYSMRGAWWNLAASSAHGYDANRNFGELWVHPKLTGRYSLGGQREIYGALSAGWSQTVSGDAFDYRDQGAVRFENAHLGLRETMGSGWYYDLSVGRQPFTLGTGVTERWVE